MHVSVAGPHRSERRSEISSNSIQNRFAERETSGAVADQGRKNIAVAEGKTDGYAESFLAAAEENAAVDLAGSIKAGEFFVENSREQHEAIRPEVRIAKSGFTNCPVIEHSLKHLRKLSRIPGF